MKKIDHASVTYLIIQTMAIIVAAMIIWPLLDMIWCAVIERKEFVYTVRDFIVEPIIFGIIVGVVFWLFERRKIKREGGGGRSGDKTNGGSKKKS